MARLPRFTVPGYPQHIIQRGNNRCSIFNCTKDYLFYLDKLHESSNEHGCKIHAYVLMTNHVHLLVTPVYEASISKMQQMMGRYYVQYFNYHYRRTGTLWEGRYKATLIDNERYFLTCMRYIELNPVRAKMVVAPDEYRWSSYHYNALGVSDYIISPHEEYCLLGTNDEIRQNAYIKMFNVPISAKEINTIREMTNKGWVLGSESFKKKIQKRAERPVQPASRGGDRKSEQFKALINRV